MSPTSEQPLFPSGKNSQLHVYPTKTNASYVWSHMTDFPWGWFPRYVWFGRQKTNTGYSKNHKQHWGEERIQPAFATFYNNPSGLIAFQSGSFFRLVKFASECSSPSFFCVRFPFLQPTFVTRKGDVCDSGRFTFETHKELICFEKKSLSGTTCALALYSYIIVLFWVAFPHFVLIADM